MLDINGNLLHYMTDDNKKGAFFKKKKKIIFFCRVKNHLRDIENGI
jgi:hypothetical protein